ncbi:MAG TPA: CPBP family intramembrane glutamic endopeptidase, partial [Herpetosiphonaceae bacterium]|nr:CPBP family intramembrane glutamic endopeptidase [Herpetosiphonaceae bacterium]
AAIVVSGQLGDFLLAGFQVVPFAILALLAYVGVRHQVATVFALLWLALVLFGLAGASALFAFAALLARSGALTSAMGGNALGGDLLPPGGGSYLVAVSLWSLAGLVVAGLVLVPPLRRVLARVLPIDPRSTVHAIALSVVTGATIIGFGQLAAAGGVPPLLEMVEAVPDVAEGAGGNELLTMVYGFAWTLPAGLMAVGFPVVRTLGQTLQRLGLVRPTGRQVIGALVLAVLMVGGATLLDAGISRVWQALGWPRTDTAAFERLLGAAISPLGAVVIGVTAGVGEEMVVRGALQPRLGILLSNLFFASLHAFQYGFDGVLSVFVIGLILGVVRARSNTTTSSIVHGVYDFILVMIAALGLFE